MHTLASGFRSVRCCVAAAAAQKPYYSDNRAVKCIRTRFFFIFKNPLFVYFIFLARILCSTVIIIINVLWGRYNRVMGIYIYTHIVVVVVILLVYVRVSECVLVCLLYLGMCCAFNLLFLR